MMRVTLRSCLLAASAAAVLAAWPGALAAQAFSALADALVRETYEAIREAALRPPDVLTLLHETVLTAQQALAAAGVTEPPPLPAFIGQEDRDLTAAAAYVQAAATAAPRDSDRIVATVLRAMIRAVADPMSAVFMPLEFTRYHRELRGEHTGIGVQIDVVRGQIAFSDVTVGGPAARVGISPGDVLLETDGRPVVDSTPDQVMDRLHGAVGTTVALVVRRAAGGIVQLSLVREPVRENPTRWKMVEPHLGYLRLLEFSEETSADVTRSVGGLLEAGAPAVVLELRENGGGALGEGVSRSTAGFSHRLVALEGRRGALKAFSLIPPAHPLFRPGGGPV